MKSILLIVISLLHFMAIAQKHEKDISANFSFELKKQMVEGVSMNYYEQGKGEPILFLHGIPSNAYLWRNILPTASTEGRAIAVDLAGFGLSDLPLTDFGIASQYRYLKGFIDAQELKNITLVVNDLGSLLGLKYAVENPDNIKRIVFIEAAFMPADQFYKQLTMMQKMMFKMMGNPKRANKMIVEQNKIPSMMMKMAVNRKLTSEEMTWYLNPYENNTKRREVLLKGPGPATFPSKGVSTAKGDFADELNKISTGLIALNEHVPFLLFTASPGMITRKPAIAYAQQNFKHLSIVDLGKGKHFLQEDHPMAIADHLVSFLKETNKQNSNQNMTQNTSR